MLIPLDDRIEQLEFKKSLFIASASAVQGPEEAKEKILETREKHPKCSHVVWAYCVGAPEKTTHRMSDDGEPKGTAGRPVLGVIQSRNMTNILITVVRYFGGIKLGRGGLVRAYTQSAAKVVENLKVREIIPKVSMLLEMEYGLHDRIESFLKKSDVQIEEQTYSTNVTVRCIVEKSRLDETCTGLKELSGGRIQINNIESSP